MLIVVKEIWHMLAGDGKGKLRIRGFNGGLQASYWLALAFLLYTTIPHSVRVLGYYEPNGDEGNSIAMALAIELVPSLAFLMAMHLNGLRWWVKAILITLATPFLYLSFLIQSEAFSRSGRHQIDSSTLALALPYGVVVTSLGIAIVTNYIAKHRDEISIQLKTVTETIEAKWREIYDRDLGEARKQLAAYEQERVRLIAQVEQKQAMLDAPDPLREIADQQLNAAREDLAHERDERAALQVQARQEVEKLLAQIETLRRELAAVREENAGLRAARQVVVSSSVKPVAQSLDTSWHEEALRLAEQAQSAGQAINYAKIGRAVGKTRQAVSNFLKEQTAGVS